MPHKIAVVEDELPIQTMYRLKLEREGFDVVTACNGLEGLEISEKHRPDLILLDLRMPVMSGDEMLNRLRATEWGAATRVIILTNISRHEAPAALRFLNVDCYVVKAHYTPTQVVTLVHNVLGTKPASSQTLEPRGMLD